jgi:polyferredoxin
MRLPKILRERRMAQGAMAVVVAAIGVQFTLWIRPHLAGVAPVASRPPGVEGFLPIAAMMAARRFLAEGIVDAVHPAGLAIFLAACLMSLLVARSFCSHLCPVGWISELLGRAGIRLFGRNFLFWKWIDLPLRGIKWFLLGFFVWAVWLSMDLEAVAAFLRSPYAKVADAKMWLFFASPDRVTLSVLGLLAVGSLFVRDLWCRYLCPYGALLGLLGRLSPMKVTRDPSTCIDCRSCTKVCPARLPVHAMKRVASVECTSCQDCVLACPVRDCLAVRPPLARPGRRALRPALVAAVAVALWLAVTLGFRLAGHWRTAVSEGEFARRLAEIDSPVYSHAGERAMVEPEAVPPRPGAPVSSGFGSGQPPTRAR